MTLETTQSLKLLYQSQTSPIHLERPKDTVKTLDLGNKNHLGGNCILSLCFLRCKYSTWFSLETKVILIRKRKKKKKRKGYFNYYLAQILVKIFSHLSSERVTLIYSICQKHNLGPTVILQTNILHYWSCLMVKILK